MPRTRFEADIEALNRRFFEMGVCTQEMLRDAVDALSRQDMALVEAILERDDEVDRLESEIERQALLLLSTRDKIADDDLRNVSSALKAITDLERIGDHSVNIAKTARRLWTERVIYRPLFDVPRLQEIASRMLHNTLDAFARGDSNAAHAVVEADDEADVFYREVQRDLRDVIRLRTHTEETSAVNDAVAASYLLFVAHYLERICDHCVSIAERVIAREEHDRAFLP